MPKKYLTLVAAALVAGAAFAQSAPTVYGVADLSLDSVSATGSTAGAAGNDIPSHTRLNANSSLFGVKGKLDVGNGNAVIYQFETYIDLGNSQYGSGNAASVGSTGTTVTGNSGPLASMFGARRDTFVGATGSWGTLKAGYLTSGFRGATAKCDLAPGSTGVTASYEVFGAAGLGKNYFQRYNSVMYSTPDFGGFSAVLNYIPDTQKAVEPGTVDPGGWDVLARYETKLFHVTYVHTDLKDMLFGGFTAERNKSDALFGGITFSSGTSVSAMYNMSKATLNTSPTVSNEYKENSFYIGVKQKVDNHEFMINYQSAAKLKLNSADVADTEVNSIAFRYGYNFHKNAQVYAQYAAITNGAATAINFNIGAISSGVKAGSDPKAFGVGLRVSF